MDIKQYQERVKAHFQAGTDISEATEEDWQLLGNLFLNASEDGVDGLDEFDQRILTSDEYKKLYEYEPDYGSDSDP